jgi:hypothetical protein
VPYVITTDEAQAIRQTEAYRDGNLQALNEAGAQPPEDDPDNGEDQPDGGTDGPSLADTTPAAKAQVLYILYFGRPAEPEGLNFWVTFLNDPANGTSLDARLANAADRFADSDEARTNYPVLAVDDPNPQQIGEFVNSIYRFLFERDVEGTADDPTTGLGFWTQRVQTQLAQDVPKLGEIVLQIFNGAQNDDVRIVNSKLAASQAFTDRLAERGASYEADAAQALVADITAPQTSADAEAAGIAAANAAPLADPTVDAPTLTIDGPTEAVEGTPISYELALEVPTDTTPGTAPIPITLQITPGDGATEGDINTPRLDGTPVQTTTLLNFPATGGSVTLLLPTAGDTDADSGETIQVSLSADADAPLPINDATLTTTLYDTAAELPENPSEPADDDGEDVGWSLTLTAREGSRFDTLEGTYTGEFGSVSLISPGFVVYGFNIGDDDVRETGEWTLTDDLFPPAGAAGLETTATTLVFFRVFNDGDVQQSSGPATGELALTIEESTDETVAGTVEGAITGLSGFYDVVGEFTVERLDTASSDPVF